jgi:hypothetical protein
MEHSPSRSPPGSFVAGELDDGRRRGSRQLPRRRSRRQCASELSTGTIGARRAWTVDDLGVVDALEVDRGDAEVGVAELTLDDDQQHAFAGHFDGVRVAQLVRREAPTHPASRATRRSSERAAPAVHGRPRVGPLTMQNSGPTGSSTRTWSHGWSCSHAQSSIPASRCRPPLPRRTSSDPCRGSRSASASASASQIRRPARHSTTINPRGSASPCCAAAARRGTPAGWRVSDGGRRHRAART